MTIQPIVTHLCTLCDKPRHTRVYCKSHYNRLLNSGELKIIQKYVTGPPEKRFWSRVIKTDGCWEWSGYTDKYGYGKITINNKSVMAHRFSWELHNGPIPPGLFIIHSCDRCGCVNPEHLRPGTAKDNAGDMVSRNRNHIGEDHYKAKLTEPDVFNIYALLDEGLVHSEIAKIYNLSRAAIYYIDKGRIWKHLTRPSHTITDQMILI